MAAWVFGVLVMLVSGVLSENDRVDLTVYYESLCPDSESFFHDQLRPVYQKIPTYLNVELVPYGNAHYGGKHDNYTFTCQHGPEECYGNIVQTCFIYLVNDTAKQIKFVNCAFEAPSQRKTLEKCIDSRDLRRQVKKCVTSSLGRNLEYEMAKKTDALSPPKSFIPWITVNGNSSREMTDKAINDLLSVVCDTFQNEKPKVCQRNKWNLFLKFRNNYL